MGNYVKPSWHHVAPGSTGKGYVRRTTVGNMVSMSYGFGIQARTATLRNMQMGLDKQIAKIKGRTAVGLKAAANYLHEDTEKTEPTTPLSEKEHIHLRDTWYDRVVADPAGATLEMGYTAPYALYVHEMTEPPYQDVDWTTAGSGAKWFEKAIHRNKGKMLEIIGNTIDIK